MQASEFLACFLAVSDNVQKLHTMKKTLSSIIQQRPTGDYCKDERLPGLVEEDVPLSVISESHVLSVFFSFLFSRKSGVFQWLH